MTDDPAKHPAGKDPGPAPKKTGARKGGSNKKADQPTVKQAPSEPIEPGAATSALAGPGGLTRRKMNRGSTRRISRAHEAVDNQLAAFAKEIDLQAYMTDGEGNRTGSCDLVQRVAEFRDYVRKEIAGITTPR